MRKETAAKTPTIVAEELLSWTEEVWSNKWRDIEFTKSFPGLVIQIVSPEKRNLFLEKSRKAMLENATSSLMNLTWNPGKSSYAGASSVVDENLKTYARTEKNSGVRSRQESLIRVNIGSLILLGKSLNGKDHINNLF